jgi:hypothetical protein
MSLAGSPGEEIIKESGAQTAQVKKACVQKGK